MLICHDRSRRPLRQCLSEASIVQGFDPPPTPTLPPPPSASNHPRFAPPSRPPIIILQDGWDSANAAQTQRWIESIYAKQGAENTLLFCSSCSGLVEHEGLRAVFDDVSNTFPCLSIRRPLPDEPESVLHVSLDNVLVIMIHSWGDFHRHHVALPSRSDIVVIADALPHPLVILHVSGPHTPTHPHAVALFAMTRK